MLLKTLSREIPLPAILEREKLAEWDVLDRIWPVPYYDDMFSRQPFRGDKCR
jgi:hypothetical protein